MTRRLTLSYVGLALFVLLVLEIPLGFAFADRQTDELILAVERDAFAIAGFVEEELEGEEPTEGQEPIDAQAVATGYEAGTGGRVVIVDLTGLAVADSNPLSPGERYFDTRPEFAEALDGFVSTGTRNSETLGEKIVYVAVPVASGGVVHGAVRITFPTSEVDDRIRENWIRLGGIAVVTLGLAAGIGVLLARSVSRPLRELQEVAAALGGGDLSTRAPTGSGPSEVRELARDFNDMASRLEQLVDAQESFVADASHQLRSPLAALRLRLENLEAGATDADAADVEAAAREVARVSRIVDGLLALARADRTSGHIQSADVGVARVLDDRAEVWAALAEERGVDLVVEDPGTLSVVATEDRLAQVLDNLIANAVEAVDVGGQVVLSASAVGARVEMHVVDDGPGLTPEERERAFDRFWRAEREGGELGGTGLGLAIVAKLIRADGGEVELRGASGGGIDATVILPLDV